MGGVALLHPQDLFHHNPLISPPMKSLSHSLRRNPNPPPPRSSNRRKRSPQKNTPSPSPLKENNHLLHRKPPTATNNNTLGPGPAPVKILKRGEPLPLAATTTPPSLDLTPEKHQPVHKAAAATANTTTTKKKKMAAAGVSRDLVVLAPPQPGFNQIRRISDCYAGSAFVSSPPPSSLPVPAFFKKKNLVLADDDTTANNNGDATTDLLRLLRLDLS